MRLARSLAFAGVATLIAGAAFAVKPADHVMTVALPDGQTAQVHYTGDVPPRIVVRRAAPTSMFASAFGPDSPFAALDRISAEMDARAAAMMRQASAMRAASAASPQGNPAVDLAAFANAPAGATSYTMVTTSNGSTVCSRSTQVTSMGAGKPPQVIRKVSDNCGETAKPAVTAPIPTALPAPKTAPAPGRDTI